MGLLVVQEESSISDGAAQRGVQAGWVSRVRGGLLGKWSCTQEEASTNGAPLDATANRVSPGLCPAQLLEDSVQKCWRW